MYNSFFILLAGILPFVMMGIPAGYCLNRKLSKKPSAECTYAYALFMGYIGYSVPAIYLTSFGIPVRKFGFILLAAAVITLGIFIFHLKKNEKLSDLIPSKWFVISALIVFAVLNFGFLTMNPLHYRMDDFSDLRYYTAAGEAWKTIPHRNWMRLYSEKNALWLSWAAICNNGMERICPVLSFSLISTWAGVDTSAVSGAVGNLAVFFVFSGTVSFMDGLKVPDSVKGAAAVWTALCPMVVISMLNCFLPMTMMIGAVIFACTFFPRLFERPCILCAVAAGGFIGVFMETVLDGLYILWGLYILTLVCMLFAGRIRAGDLRLVLTGAAVSLLTVLPVIRAMFLELVSTSSVRTAFNSIYAFAYSRTALTFAFFGTKLTGRGSVYVFAVTILSIVLVFAGILGLVLYFLRTRDFRFTNILAVLAVSLFFLALSYEAQYAFYKVFQLGFPGLVIGTVLFVVFILQEFSRAGKKTGFWRYKAASLLLIAVMTFVVICSAGGSCGHIYRCSVKYTNAKDANPNLTYLTKDGRPNWEVLDTIGTVSGKNILYISNNEESHAQTLFSYFGRGNRIWYLDPETYELSKINGYGWQDVEPENEIPADAEIYIEDGKEKFILNDAERDGFISALGCYGPGDTRSVTLDGSPAAGVNRLRLIVFSRENRSVELTLNVTAENGGEEIVLRTSDGKGTEALRFPVNEDVPVRLQVGAGRSEILFEAEAGQTFSLNSYRIGHRYSADIA